MFEPGSTYKAFTIAGAMGGWSDLRRDEFLCDGSQVVVEGESPIYCSYRAGHGMVDVKRALAVSCNDALMQIADKEGPETFDKYQMIFNIGSKTGIDLEGETTGIKYDVENLNPTELATSSFGQGVTTSMIQMAAGFCSVINGGNYYQPHVVKEINSESGAVVSSNDNTLVKRVVSEDASKLIRKYLEKTVEDDEGTASPARVKGYVIGGKTGTAEKWPRNEGKYLVSFMGFAPYDNPQVLIYVVVNEPNVADQPHSVFAQNIAREILEEVLPYMNIYPDEKKTGVNKGYDVTGSKDSSQYTGKP